MYAHAGKTSKFLTNYNASRMWKLPTHQFSDDHNTLHYLILKYNDNDNEKYFIAALTKQQI